MTARPRFEIVRTVEGWHARFIPSIDARPWRSQTTNAERKAFVDIYAFTGHTVQPSNGYPPEFTHYVQGPKRLLEVRRVDERPEGLAHGTHAGVNRGCPCALCREFRAEYVGSDVPDGEAS